MKIVGSKQTSNATRKLRGGPQSLLPTSPVRGMTFSSPAKGLTPFKPRNYVVARQSPLFSGLKHFGKGFV